MCWSLTEASSARSGPCAHCKSSNRNMWMAFSPSSIATAALESALVGSAVACGGCTPGESAVHEAHRCTQEGPLSLLLPNLLRCCGRESLDLRPVAACVACACPPKPSRSSVPNPPQVSTLQTDIGETMETMQGTRTMELGTPYHTSTISNKETARTHYLGGRELVPHSGPRFEGATLYQVPNCCVSESAA